MINDKFNNRSKFDLKAKLQDKKFVSTVGIGIFVLILIIVLIASCNKKKKPDPRNTQQQTTTQQTVPQQTATQQTSTQQNNTQQIATTDYTDAENDDAQSLMLEGKHYYNGDGGKKRDYRKARECFVKAEKQGAKNAGFWIKQCDKKLPKPKTKKRR